MMHLQDNLESYLQPVLNNKKVLLGISGSIAAFKACDIIRLLKTYGAHVRVVLTESAHHFVTKVTLETLSGQPIYDRLWHLDTQGTHHIDAARWADVVLIAPATANIISKLALGLADDLLSTELLAFQGPLLIAPAMNPAMFSHPGVQHNLTILTKRGAIILGPEVGQTACGEEGLGRMSEPIQCVETIAECFYKKPNKKRVLITLGPTRSFLDPVRYLTNRSSGLMGAALSWAAVERGYHVTAICGPISNELLLPRSARVIHVTTAREMATSALLEWPKSHVFFSTAAVLDWDIKHTSTQKIKKESHDLPEIQFKKNLDILATICKKKRSNQFVVGFAAETEKPIENGTTKRLAKNCDALFVNDVSKKDIGFESQLNEGWWITKSNVTHLERQSKFSLALKMFDLMETKKKTTHVLERVSENYLNS